MPTVRLGAVFGALCVLGACVPVDDDPPVSGSKPIQQLSGHEVVYLCDWALDYMGGYLSNPEDDPGIGEAIYHRCTGGIGVPEEERENEDIRAFRYTGCLEYLVEKANQGCTLTVNDFAGWIEAIGDTPCEHHYVSNGMCYLYWPRLGEESEEAP